MSPVLRDGEDSDAGEELSLALRPQIEGLLAAVRDGLSEQSFAHLYLFREQRAYRLRRGELPSISGRSADGERTVLPLFDPAQASTERLAAVLHGHDCFYPISQRSLAHFDRDQFVADSVHADSDYIYPVESFVDYRGPELDAKRQALEQLLQRFRPVAVPLGRASLAEAQKILQAWTAAHPDPVAQGDVAPCLEAIERSEELSLTGYVYYAEETPIGFVLGEMIAEDALVLHFVKALPEVPSAFEMMFHHLALAQARRVRWFNFEQDHGLERLRQAMMAFEPSMLLPKFRVRMALRAAWSDRTGGGSAV